MNTRRPSHQPDTSRRTAAPGHALIFAAAVALLATLLPAQQQFAELTKRGLPADTATTTATVLGDVDGDGDLDLIAGNSAGLAGQQNRLYLNDGKGTFTDATATHMPFDSDNSRSLALGDIDRDGDLDLIVGNYSGLNGQQNRLYLNNGRGRFTDVTATHMRIDTDNTRAVVLGDVDGDGDLDLITGNQSQQNRLYLNNGAGMFADATAFSMPAASDATSALQLGDVDGDGDLDLIVGNSEYGATGQQNRLYLNSGAGVFTDATAGRMPIDNDITFALAAGDFDGDRDLDLIIGNSGAGSSGQQNRLYLNNGAGTFTDATAARLPVAYDFTRALAAGDLDGDGDLDLVVGNSGAGGLGQQDRLYLNDGTGTFTDATVTRLPAAADFTFSLSPGDCDGDGDLDLIAGSPGQNRLYLGDGRGAFSDATAKHLPVNRDTTYALATGDLDGDGDLDLVLGAGGRTSIYLNSGNGTFTDASATHATGLHGITTSLAIGDCDGDGDLDLAAWNPGHATGQQNRLYLNDGTGRFSDATRSRMPVAAETATSMVFGDVDGDGDLDLVVGNQGYPGQQNRLYLNNGAGTFTDATATRMPAILDYTRSLALADVDGDGDLDLVTGNDIYPVGEQNRLYLNNGAGTFTDVTAARMPVAIDSTYALATGDVDGDGDLDLIFGNTGHASSGQQNTLYLNDGTGTFTDATASRMPVVLDYTRSLAVGDVDGDGDLDLVVGNLAYVGEQNRLYLNDGAGSFTDVTAARMPTADDPTLWLALGDVDRDGDLDLFVGGLGQDRLYLNLLRQLDAPFVLHLGRTYQLDAYARYGPARLVDVALVYFSPAAADIPLPPLGRLGIDPNLMTPLPALIVPQPAGVGSISIQVPNVPALAGIAVHTQALLLQAPLPARLTNVNRDRVLR